MHWGRAENLWGHRLNHRRFHRTRLDSDIVLADGSYHEVYVSTLDKRIFTQRFFWTRSGLGTNPRYAPLRPAAPTLRRLAHVRCRRNKLYSITDVWKPIVHPLDGPIRDIGSRRGRDVCGRDRVFLKTSPARKYLGPHGAMSLGCWLANTSVFSLPAGPAGGCGERIAPNGIRSEALASPPYISTTSRRMPKGTWRGPSSLAIVVFGPTNKADAYGGLIGVARLFVIGIILAVASIVLGLILGLATS